MSLTVTTKKTKQDSYMVYLTGSLDTDTCPILEEKIDPLLEGKPEMIAFDMEKLTYINSMGIRVIAKTMKALKENEGKVMLLNLQPQIKKVFDIIKLLPSQQIFTSIAELDNYLDHIQKKITGFDIQDNVINLDDQK
jgi:anti-anti-sigma factor